MVFPRATQQQTWPAPSVETRSIIASAIVALLLHVVIVVALQRVKPSIVASAVPHLLDLDREVEDVTTPPPPSPPSTSSPNESPQPRTSPSPAARAPSILTRPADPSPRDERDETVSGDHPDGPGGPSRSSSGGIDPPVSSSSTTTAPVPPAPPPARPLPQPVPTVDRSRGASLVRAGEWSCPWPAEAEVEAIDEALVVIRATVDASGRATRIDVVNDPGHGFGREARRCAMRERYVPALDRDGRPIASITSPIRVRFSR